MLLHRLCFLLFFPPLCIMIVTTMTTLFYSTIRCGYCSDWVSGPLLSDSPPVGNLFYTHNVKFPLFIDDSHSHISTWVSPSNSNSNIQDIFHAFLHSVIPLSSVQKARSFSSTADLHEWYHWFAVG